MSASACREPQVPKVGRSASYRFSLHSLFDGPGGDPEQCTRLLG